MNGRQRINISLGLEVDIVLKKDQRTGKLTRGIIKDILTNSSSHPHGIKVRLQDGQVGRVQYIVQNEKRGK
ncbi:YwbE family protein [Bacillus manliponensis]|uniref:YwbE family protein n=1 Tax=Bacillus manliponensis TaxID=574376 RepID=UPI0035114565